jgi:hypothetical protein
MMKVFTHPLSAVANTLVALRSRFEQMLKDGDVIYLARRVLSRLHAFEYMTCYLYEHDVESIIRRRAGNEYLPRFPDFHLEIISTKEQAAWLALYGHDIRSFAFFAHRSLGKGGVAFCVFVGKELASICWIALTKEAKDNIAPPPYYVDFSREACLGSGMTAREYQGRGLFIYTAYCMYRFLRERGIATARSDVPSGNFPSHKAHAYVGATVYARVRYLKILWWQFRRESAVSSVLPIERRHRPRHRSRIRKKPLISAPIPKAKELQYK